jgi:hypothetical protein
MGCQVTHGRIKPKYNPRPNAEERRHEERLEQMPCLNCGAFGVELHHVLQDFPGKRFRRDHRYQIPLCAGCHRGPYGVHGVGNEALWADAWKIDVVAEAGRLWSETKDG